MAKTAMRQLIDMMNKSVKQYSDNAQQEAIFFALIEEAKKLLETEKQQILDAHNVGYGKGSVRSKTLAETYFTQTYRQGHLTVKIFNMKKLLIAFLFIPLFGAAQKYDTTRCIMLLCDTSKLNYYAPDYDPHNYSVYWKFGYEVLGYVPQGWGEGDVFHTDYWELVGYLDENKNPLKKSIIVWQAKKR